MESSNATQPKTKRYLVYLISAIIIIMVFAVLSYNITRPRLCQLPCEWVVLWGGGFCDCNPSTPLPPPETTGLPEGNPCALTCSLSPQI